MIDTIRYQWTGVIASGQKVGGIIEAQNVALAKIELRKQGIILRNIVKRRQPLSNLYNRGIKQDDITLFTRQLATLARAGVSLMCSFELMKNGSNNDPMKTLINTLRKDVGSGLMLAQALRKHTSLFNPIFCSMVDAGEQSGSLDVMLDKLATQQEKSAAIKKKVKKALAYPLVVMLIAILITSGFLIFVIPQFESLFVGFGADLPFATRLVINLSNFFKTWWLLIFSLIGILIYVFIFANKHYPGFTKLNHQFVLKIPLIGSILKNASISRFARTLAITFAAGQPLTDALNAVAAACGNNLFSEATYSIKKEISNGQSLQRAIQHTQLFPDLVIQLIGIGEESGTLEQMLEKIADFFEKDVDNAVDILSGLLEPVIMTILGLLVGGLVVAMYLPILKLGTVV